MKIIIRGKHTLKKIALYDIIMLGLKEEKSIKYKGSKGNLGHSVIWLNPHLPSFITVTFNTDKNLKVLLKEIYECIPLTRTTMDRLFQRFDHLLK